MAKSGVEVLAQLLGARALPLAADADARAAARPTSRAGSRTPRPRRRHGCAISAFSSSTDADPLAAGLDHVLRAIRDPHVALGVDRDDVAGLEPAVVGEAVGLLAALEVARRDPGAAHLELAHRLAVPRSTAALVVDRRAARRSGTGEPCVARRRAASPRRRCGLAHVVATRSRAGWSRSCPRRGPRSGRGAAEAPIIARGAAEPPMTIVRSVEQIPAARARASSIAEDADPDRRHAGGDRDALAASQSARAATPGRGCGPGNTIFAPTISAGVRVGPRRWRGTSARPAGTCPSRSRGGRAAPQRLDERVQRRSSGGCRGRPSAIPVVPIV